MEKTKLHTQEKTVMVIASLLSGVIIAFIVGDIGILYRILIALLIAISYPFLAAISLKICESMRSWAYITDVEPWGEGDRIFLAALWPVTLIICLIIYIFLGIIHRLF